MPTIDILKQTGEKAGVLELDDSVFGVEYNEPLIHQAVVAQLNNARQGTKSALTRTEVRGGGIKPWRQKGTGRARQGSIRAPQWNKGGVVFAPKPRDFSQKINKTAKVGAMKSALSKKLADGQIVVVDEIKLAEAKTKEMVKVVKALGLEKNVVLCLTETDADVVRAANNLPNVTTVASELASVYDVVAGTKFVATKAAIEKITERCKA
ncbi:MAG: 50S ribosomal protein L4 [Clostridia bacterium]|jgi:large subunit ribosomal protein L4|nr:50S ribosomal protein L4 [Clostridia bacterium]